MILECIYYIKLLGLAMFLNIIIGLYNSIAINKLAFDKGVLIRGIEKAVIVCVTALGLAYIMDCVPMDVSILTPKALLESSVLYYSAKVELGNNIFFKPIATFAE